jgi:mercuric transport protein
MRKWTLALMAVIWAGTAGVAPTETVVLQAANMTCPTCSITIEKALEKVPGVADTAVDTKAATVTVTFDSERTSASDIARAITEAGFPAKARTNGG